MKHINAVTKKEYAGTNQGVLKKVAEKNSYISTEWLTFVQAKSLGRNIVKGQQGVKLVKFIEDDVFNKEKNKTETKTGFRTFTVFNFEQTADALTPEKREEFETAQRLKLKGIKVKTNYSKLK